MQNDCNGKKIWMKKAIIVIVIFYVFFQLFTPLQKIKVGECGIVYHTLTGETGKAYLYDGWHLVVPFMQEVTVYPVSARIYGIARNEEAWLKGQDTSIWVPTSDKQRVSLDVYITYCFREERFDEIFRRFQGKDIETIEAEYLDNAFKDAVIAVITQNTMLDVYSQRRAEIQDDIKMLLQKKLEPIGIDIESILLKEVRLTPEAEAVLSAETRKQAAIIEAVGKSEANQLISKSLTENIIKLQTLERLGSDLKLVIVPSTSKNQINLDGIFDSIAGGTDEKGDSKPDYKE